MVENLTLSTKITKEQMREFTLTHHKNGLLSMNNGQDNKVHFWVLESMKSLNRLINLIRLLVLLKW
jgi:hypothetical protein